MPNNLRRIQYLGAATHAAYPFNLPWLAEPFALDLTAPVTVLSGENGTGKSTLLNAVALNYNAILLSGAQPDRREYAGAAALSDRLKLNWLVRSKTGFFFRADDFISYVRATKERERYALQQLARIPDPHSYERMPYARTLNDIQNLYHKDISQLSHGQTFLALFENRLRPNGIYLLDEPEAALSPQNQLSLLVLMRQAVEDGAQFIMATHSPILMAYPEAQLLAFDSGRLAPIKYDDLEHVQLMRNFLADPKRYMHYLF